MNPLSEKQNEMAWEEEPLRRLSTVRRWSYHADGPGAAEPTALAALALLAHGQTAAAGRAIDWLTRVQQPDGSVPVTATEKIPRWPTSLAMLAWHAWDDAHQTSRMQGCLERAIRWTLRARGNAYAQSPDIGHDMTLTGWPWVLGTHSWLEPTAYFVAALKATGHAAHPRTREGVRLLVDRLLPSGGCNCGNTIVMGQELLPHVQPTGLVLLALASERAADGTVEDPRIERSLAYLERSLPEMTAPASLAFGLMGLTAHNRRPAAADEWFARSCSGASPLGTRPFTDALAALAALPRERNPLIAFGH